MIDVPQTDSVSLAQMRQASAFDVLLPAWLPAKTDVVSYRWWSAGNVVEIHTCTREKFADDLTGRLTMKEWTGGVSAESAIISTTPGFEVRVVAANSWLYSSGDPDVWLGVVGDVNILISTVFDADEVQRVIESLR